MYFSIRVCANKRLIYLQLFLNKNTRRKSPPWCSQGKSVCLSAENSRKQIHDVLPDQKIEKSAKTDKIKTTRTSQKFIARLFKYLNALAGKERGRGRGQPSFPVMVPLPFFRRNKFPCFYGVSHN